MKRLFYKYILRAKCMVNQRFFWSVNNACDYAQKLGGKQIVWSVDYKKLATFNHFPDFSVHPDANNFNPYQ
tara:strand:+ start:143 stop:355 length:213 start_codon:yes stop_codon:yes gene_type:complete